MTLAVTGQRLSAAGDASGVDSPAPSSRRRYRPDGAVLGEAWREHLDLAPLSSQLWPHLAILSGVAGRDFRPHLLILLSGRWGMCAGALPAARCYGLANVTATRTAAAGPRCLEAVTVQVPARWAGRNGNRSRQRSCVPWRVHDPGSFVEPRMLSCAPYHVLMFTATSADAGAATVTVNVYRAGGGAVIRYRAEERPAVSTRLDACGRWAAGDVRVAGLAWRWVPRLFPLVPVHAVAVSASAPQTATAARHLLISLTDAIGGMARARCSPVDPGRRMAGRAGWRGVLRAGHG